MQTARPKLHVPRTATEKAVETVAALGLLALAVIAVAGWLTAKGVVPTHFGPSGKPDAWGHRASLLLLPMVVVPLYVGLTVLSRFPHVYNHLVPITVQNAAGQYRTRGLLLFGSRRKLSGRSRTSNGKWLERETGAEGGSVSHSYRFSSLPSCS